MGKVTKAVIPAAGLGTRFLPVTKAQPKEMLPVVDKPAIQYVVEEAVAAGIEDILIVTSSGKRSVEDHFDVMFELENVLEAKGKHDQLAEVRALTDLADFHFVRQGEALGLGHAVGTGAAHVGDEPFVVMLPDDIMYDKAELLKGMLATYADTGKSVVALKEFGPSEISSYGCADPASRDGNLVQLKGIVEKPPAADAPSNLAVMGRYVFTPRIFDELARTKPGVGGEIQLTDAMAAIIAAEGMSGVVFVDGRYDIGQKSDYLRAQVELALDHPELGPGFREFLAEFVKAQGIV